jgi:hypothetical protein
VSIHTDISPPLPKGPGPGGNPNEHSGGVGGGEGAGYGVTEPVPATPQATPDLLNEIISKIGPLQPGAQPTDQLDSPTGDQGYTQHGLETAPGPTGPTGAEPTLALGKAFSLGDATLTLTPGLSTTVGSGAAATAIAITTNPVGQTIIVISSSGTAVSATVSKTAATLTLSAPKTGFDASITAAALPGDHSNTSGSASTSTASKGSSADRWRWNVEWWFGIAVGMGFVL